MNLFVLTTAAMLAFAANSVLNRAALAEGLSGPGTFMALRLCAGALVLALLLALRRQSAPGPWPVRPAALLLVYMVGFSYAYQSLDTGLGALILFGGVQLTMFAAALVQGERPGPRRWIGAAMGLSGLALIFWPTDAAPTSPVGAALMLAAAIGWGLYSMAGRSLSDPLATTARAFILAAPFGVVLALARPDATPMTLQGAALAICSGAFASGLGYALWYRVLPHLKASTAAIGQLTVPIIAMAGGAVFLGESLSTTFLIAASLVLAGVLIATVQIGASK